MAYTISKRFRWIDVLGAQDIKLKRDLRDMRFLYTALLAAVLCVAVLLIYLWSRLMVVNIGYEISRVTLERDALVEQNRRLRLKFERLKSPERIEAVASMELDLVHPRKEQVINLR